MDESRIIEKRNARTRKVDIYVAHVLACEDCNGVGYGDCLVSFSACRTRPVTCDECKGTGEVEDPDCYCARCLANWKGLLLSESLEPKFAAEIRDWVADRERDNAQQKADEAAGVRL